MTTARCRGADAVKNIVAGGRANRLGASGERRRRGVEEFGCWLGEENRTKGGGDVASMEAKAREDHGSLVNCSAGRRTEDAPSLSSNLLALRILFKPGPFLITLLFTFLLFSACLPRLMPVPPSKKEGRERPETAGTPK